MDIGGVKIESRLALAPMAGVGDMAFRIVCRGLGAGLTYTEMVSAKALCYGDKKTAKLLELGPEEHPAAVQIFGSDPESIGEGAAIAAELSGADFLDINMGCPVGKVVKSGDGCALMKDPELAQRVIEAAVKSVKIPVTVKIRKGWDGGRVNAVEFAQMAERAGASAIAVHGRTRTQMYSGRADWDIIREVKRSVSVPVIANGDVFTAADALRILKYTGADMAMIGRAAFGNPWIFQQADALLKGEEAPSLPPLSERVELAVSQFEMAAAQKGEGVAALEARKHFAWYLKGVPYSGYYKKRITEINSLEDLYKTAEGIKRELRDG